MARPRKPSRRGRHEGSVRKTKSGSWEASISAGRDKNGKRRRIYRNARTKKEALRILAELQQQPLVSRSGSVTLSAYVGIWLTDKERSVQSSTLARYQQLTRYVHDYIGHMKVSDVNVVAVRQWYVSMTSDGCSSSTQKKASQLLGACLRQAQRDGLVRENAVFACPRPRVPRPKLVIFTAEESRQFLRAAESDRMYAMFATALGTGARIGELCALTWPDVDFENRTIRFDKTTTQATGKVTVKQSKTAGSVRTIPMAGFVWEALSDHRKELVVEGLAKCELVFPTKRGTPQERSNIHSYHFKPTLKRAGLPDVPFHSLRHSAASMLIAQGVDAKTVSEILGHASVRFTLDTYVHGTSESRSRAIDRLGDALG